MPERLRDSIERILLGLIGFCLCAALVSAFLGCSQPPAPPAPPNFTIDGDGEPMRASTSPASGSIEVHLPSLDTIAYKPPRIEIAPPPEDHPASATRCACGVDCRCRAPCTLHHLGARVDHSGGYYELEWVWHPVAHTPPVRASPPAGWTCGPDGCFQGNDGFEPARRGLLRRR